MILGQLNCFLLFAFLGSSVSFLESIRSPLVVCLSKSTADAYVDLHDTLVDAGKKHFLFTERTLSSRSGNTTTFKDDKPSISKRNVCFREKGLCAQTEQFEDNQA